jgi:hypothetical protein
VAHALCIINAGSKENSRLGSASLASRGGSSLGVGLTRVGLGTLFHHDGEGDVSTLGIFVSGLTRVDARCVGAVSFPGLEGVEVVDTAGGSGVPSSVDFDLGGVVPHAVVVLSVVTEDLRRSTNTEGGGREGRGGGRKGSNGEDGFGELQVKERKAKVREGSFGARITKGGWSEWEGYYHGGSTRSS